MKLEETGKLGQANQECKRTAEIVQYMNLMNLMRWKGWHEYNSDDQSVGGGRSRSAEGAGHEKRRREVDQFEEEVQRIAFGD